MLNVDQSAKAELLQRLETWRDNDKPLVEAIGDTLHRGSVSTPRSRRGELSTP